VSKKNRPFSIAKRLAECYTDIDAYSNFNALARLEILCMRALAHGTPDESPPIPTVSCPSA
jgi:hypothetical protein